jgi:hypothetical protein
VQHKHPLALLLLALMLHTHVANAQKKIDCQELLWVRYALKLNINDTYQIRQEIEERTYWFPWRQHQFVSRTMVNRKLPKGWNAALGFTYFLQAWPQKPEVKVYENVTELRPQLELAYKQTFSEKWFIHHRYWAEFRFFEQPEGTFEFGNTRLRYKLEVSYSPTPKVTLKAFDEIFINAGKNIVINVFDQNRYGASVQYMMFKNFGIELGYLNWFQQRPSGVDFYIRDIFRLTIHHTITFKKSNI